MQTGDAIIIVRGEGLEHYGLRTGVEGFCNALITIPGSDEEYVYFMPDEVTQVYVIEKSRVEVDEKRQPKLVGEM